MRPIGYFVHHQGRGHAERCASIVNALPAERPVRIFCARADIFPPLRDGVEIEVIPSLFETRGDEAPGLASMRTPTTQHCTPCGWPAITEAMSVLAGWFHTDRPALMIVDVSAEIAQVARMCSVPVVTVVQHGCRNDPGHMAAYEGSVGLLAPYDVRLEQDDRPRWMRSAIFHAGGLGVEPPSPLSPAEARRDLDLPSEKIALVVAGSGGTGTPLAPLTMAARAMPDIAFHVAAAPARDWHATIPGNLHLHPWIDAIDTWIAAADVVIASTGNTTCHQLLAAGKPYLAVPEWRYFDEQGDKGRALAREGVAHLEPHWPATPDHWRDAIDAARRTDTEKARSFVRPDAAARTADWLEGLAARLWEGSDKGTSAPLRVAAE